RELYARQPALWTTAAHEGAARLVRFTADGRTIVTGGQDGRLMRWDADSGRALGRIDAHKGAVRAIAVVPSRKWIISAGEDGAIRAWTDDGALAREWPRVDRGVFSLDVSPDGRRLAAGDDRGLLRLWPDLDRQDAIETPGHAGTSWAVRFDPAGRRLFAGW